MRREPKIFWNDPKYEMSQVLRRWRVSKNTNK